MIYKILFLGPQGSGKGTQAKRLADKLGIPALSMGELLREEKASGSVMGTKIASFIDQGELVPDEITTQVLKKRLTHNDVQDGFVIDSFPRFLEQYESSKTFFQPTVVVVLDIPKEVSLDRIMKRAQAEGRTDDTPEKVEKRLAWSQQQTQPVIEKYKQASVAHVIDGVGSVEEVFARIIKVL